MDCCHIFPVYTIHARMHVLYTVQYMGLYHSRKNIDFGFVLVVSYTYKKAATARQFRTQ